MTQPHKAIRRFFRSRQCVLLCIGAAFSMLAPAAPAADPAQEEFIRAFQKTLTLGTGQSFRIEHKFGAVKIHGESGREVKINATIRVQAGSHSDAESYANQVQIEVEQTTQGVQVRTVYPEKGWFSGGRHTSYSADYDIAVPVDAPVFVKNNFGSIEATGVHGAADIDSNHGSIHVRDSAATRLNNSFGSIELAGATGNVLINGNYGSAQVVDVKGSLEIRSRFGNITARNIQGAATIVGGNGPIELSDAASGNITSSFGNVQVRNIRGDLTIHNNNGNIEISSVAGNAEAVNNFGGITFSDVRGRLNCTANNGRVKGSSQFGNTVTIRDSFGSIELENINGALDAETANGKISVRDARGGVILKTSFGAIEASDIPKGIRALTANGEIHLTDVGGDTYAKTSFGGILMERIGGRIEAENQNGAISATSRPANDCRDISLKTSFSSIRIGLPAGAGYNVSAHTSLGRVSSELPVTVNGTTNGETLNGTIGSGGCQLQLTNSNGSIEIVKAQ